MNSPSRQRGVAMLVAILLVALATIIAAAVAYESAMSARRSTSTFAFEQALLVDQGAEALAAYGLQQAMQGMKAGPSGTADVYPAQAWGSPIGPVEVVPGVTLEASLEDLQGRFNLNWLVAKDQTGKSGPDPVAVAAFTQLLQKLEIEPKWVDLLVDWIDSDTTPQPDGAEDSAYLGQNPPYLTANQYITSASELLALPGFGNERYQKLAPYVTALPPDTKLNICSASGVVLDAFIPGRGEWSLDEGFVKTRAAAGACYPSLQQYQASFDGGTLGAAQAKIATTSQYFRLNSLITIGTTEFNLYSLLYQDNNGPKFVHPIIRTFSAD